MLENRFQPENTRIGIIGLGYVGLPLATVFAEAGYRVLGFDVSRGVCDGINAGLSHIKDIPTPRLTPLVKQGLVEATTDFERLAECTAISICVPTPLNKIKDPDLSYVVAASEAIAPRLRPGQLIILESTTYPGTTRDLMLPILEKSGMKVGVDFFLCFSPERVDPGNERWHTKNTPKVLGGITSECKDAGMALYEKVFDRMVPVENTEAAELVKVYENTFRMINIALANEMSMVCDKLGISVWEVIDAASTKPFGFMKFTPGPGLGGHCIPLDPHYLSWKMRNLSFKTRMIELASEINAEMPEYTVNKVALALNEQGLSLKGSRILILGIAYKKDIDDLRESPALNIIRILQERCAEVLYHDPYCPVIADDGHTEIPHLPLYSTPLTDELLNQCHAVVVVTDHSGLDYKGIAAKSKALVDTRGVVRGMIDVDSLE
jgi:UDP-N-acetyl-D-glucosamine dehydrogenase